MKKIIVSGANGNIGRKLVKRLSYNPEYEVIAIVRDKKKCNIEQIKQVEWIGIEEFFEHKLNNQDIYCAVHLAFARANCTNEQIASSIIFSKNFFEKISKAKLKKVIYVSSQGVYGDIPEIRNVDMAPQPNSTYAMAKFGVEQLFNVFFPDMPHATIIRLDNVVQSQRMPKLLCNQIKTCGTINLVGGNQFFSYIDIDDAVRAIDMLVSCNGDWKPIYNVGIDRTRYTLLEISDILEQIANKYGYTVSKNYEKKDIKLFSGMNSVEFMNDTGWRPEKNIYQMLENLFLEEK